MKKLLVVAILSVSILAAYKGWGVKELAANAKALPGDAVALFESKDPQQHILGKWQSDKTTVEVLPDGSFKESGDTEISEPMPAEWSYPGTMHISYSYTSTGSWKLTEDQWQGTIGKVNLVSLKYLRLDSPAFVEAKGQAALDQVVANAKKNFQGTWLKSLEGQTIPLEVIKLSSRKLVLRNPKGEEVTLRKIQE